ELQALDVLPLAVFEDLEVFRGQSFDDLSLFGRVGVDGDEAGAAAEHRRLLLRLRREHSPGKAGEEGRGACGPEASHGSVPHMIRTASSDFSVAPPPAAVTSAHELPRGRAA